MPAGVTSHRRLLLLYLACIYLTLPLLPVAVTRVRDHFGSRPIALVSPVLAAMAAGWIILTLIRNGARRSDCFVLAGLALGGLLILFYLRANPVEQVHLLEYGLVGFLGWRGRSRDIPPLCLQGALWPAAVLGSVVLDEIIQIFIPNRVFDWRDVGVNVVSTLLGMTAASVLGGPSHPRCADDPPLKPV
jgi:hypothetical protein